jgi:hypothetical protein
MPASGAGTRVCLKDISQWSFARIDVCTFPKGLVAFLHDSTSVRVAQRAPNAT